MKRATKVFLILMLCVVVLVTAVYWIQSHRPTEPSAQTQPPETTDPLEITEPLETTEPSETTEPPETTNPPREPEQDDTNWTIVNNLSQVKDFINHVGSLERTQESAGIVTFTTSAGNADHQLLCQFAEAAENITSFKISTTVTAGTGRRGIGFKTPDGYLFFNVVNNGGENGVGYVVFDVFTDGMKKDQAYQTLDADVEAIITDNEAYTLKLVAKDLTGTSADTVTLYVDNIAVYTIGIRSDGI